MSDERNSGYGWQPPLPHQDQQTAQVHLDVCRHYVLGNCRKGARCQYRHEIDPNGMRKLEIFCRSFQQRRCNKTNCLNIHATKPEVVLFYTQGKMPQALIERHPHLNMVNGVQISSQPWPMAGREGHLQQPPPPPQPVSASASAPPYTCHSTNYFPSPSYSNTGSESVECASSTTPRSFNQVQPPQQRYDNSQLQSHYQHGSRKRHLDDCEAGPSKGRREDESTHWGNSTLGESISPCLEPVQQLSTQEKPQSLDQEAFGRTISMKIFAWILQQNMKSEQEKRSQFEDVNMVTLVQSLLALRRRQSPAPSRPSSDVISTILEAMRNSSTAERAPSAPAAAPAPLPAAPAPAAPPAARFVNGQAQRGEAAVAPAPPQPRYPPAPAPAPAPAPPQPQPRYPPAPAPAAYPPYQPAVPPPPHPPARPYYHHAPHAPPAHHAHHAYHAPPPNNTSVTTPNTASAQHAYSQWYYPTQPASASPAAPATSYPGTYRTAPPPPPPPENPDTY